MVENFDSDESYNAAELINLSFNIEIFIRPVRICGNYCQFET